MPGEGPDKLWVLRLGFEAPRLVTPTALYRPLDDFNFIYRVSSGAYGTRARRFEDPWPYARPYSRRFHFGSELEFSSLITHAIAFGGGGGITVGALFLIRRLLRLDVQVRADRAEERARRAAAETEIEKQKADAAEQTLRWQEARQEIEQRYGVNAVAYLDQIGRNYETGPIRPSTAELLPPDEPEETDDD